MATSKTTLTTLDKILIAAVAATILVAALVVLTVSSTIHNTGMINTIGFTLWADVNRTTVLGSINWGAFNPGDMHGVTAWAQDSGTINITLSFVTGNWNPPAAAQYLIFAWNYTGQTIVSGQVVPLQLTLQALSNTTGITNFSFDINMTASQV